MEYLPFLMLPVAFGLMFLGVQVAFAMLLTATLFGLVTFGAAVVHQFVEKIDDLASNFVFAAIPLFVFMGAVLEKSGIADRLFEAVHIWTRRLPGGLAIATVVMCIIFAASSGVIGATESIVGLLTIPIMLRYGYDKRLISGVICAGGSLGTIIPPSVVVIVMGPLANVSVGDLMYGMVLPGLLLAGLYLVYILALCIVKPGHGPRIPREPDEPGLGQKLAITARNLVPPLAMIVAVLGSILGGVASPTEAASIGCVCAVLLTVMYGRFTWVGMYDALLKTVRVTAMIMAVLLGGTLFTGVFVGSGGIGLASTLIGEMNLGPWALLLLLLLVLFIAGFFLDWISIVLIFLPIFTPLVTAAGFDPVWFCILFLIMIQTSYLTPPLAPAIFYLRAVAPPEITMRHMYAGMVPFIGLQLIVLAATLYWPPLVTWLPQLALQLR
ncbi:TRAP transporter large permease subunit [Calidifontimicrobium sp. SYSU G02091]|uniref:TRAP transporter large permease n=1 Tax=Calidifontimicrobium sp. SYSU G02091 TaxID=2926421 RepID=UPI001F5386F5|nr:TRAP transporter large permease subunit [Calidifontimicrobium sp. SYSU G02091]MCI1193072.1 TRAP transporter large permease subunit [Calidifontimicrobium sp. SYSU G02091]